VRRVEAVVTTYPYEERGRFASQDDTLNRVFDICRYTIRLCSNEFLMDTPFREQAQWTGDVSAVTLGGIYACFGDTAMPAKFLRQSGARLQSEGILANISNAVRPDGARSITDYSLWWVMGLWNHYLYTGDETIVDDLYPTAVRIVRTHLGRVNEHGLIEDMPFWVFIDWADVDTRGECTALNAIFYGALGALRNLAQTRGDARTAEWADQAMARLKGAFQERFFDPDRGCFADARVEGAFSPKTSEHANLAAIRWGLCDDSIAGRIISDFYERKSVAYTEAQPFFTSVVLKALDRAGRVDLALAVIRDRWGGRMVDRGATSTFEEWGVNGSWRAGAYKGFLRTLSHAWSAGAAEVLTRTLIGLEILEPGCRRVRIDPRPAPFDYDVAFPTPLGPIRVNRSEGNVSVSVPEGVTRC